MNKLRRQKRLIGKKHFDDYWSKLGIDPDFARAKLGNKLLVGFRRS